MKCCELTPGMLRHTVTVQRLLGPVSDGQGGVNKQWIDLKTKRAAINPLSGNERVFAHRLDARVTHRIYMRWDADILASDRIVYKGKTYQIRAIINIEERDHWMEIQAESGVAT